MRFRLPMTLGAAAAALALASTISFRHAPRPQAFASEPPNLPHATVAILATMPRAITTSLYEVEAGRHGELVPLATFGHIEDAAIRASAMPDETIIAIADAIETRDLSFAARAIRLFPH